MTLTEENAPISKQLVSDDERMDFLPAFFGRYMLPGEALVYAWMDRLSTAYRGGYWHFFRLSNGGRFMAPDYPGVLPVRVGTNDFEGEMSAEAAGIVATLFALGQLAAELVDTDDCDSLVEHYHWLRAFAAEHPEGRLILRAID